MYSKSQRWIKWYSRVAVYKSLRTVKILLEYKNNQAKLLDLGCGIGITFGFVSQTFPNSTACDIDEKALTATSELLARIGIKRKIVKYQGKRLPFVDNYFDIVTSIEVIEHVDDPEFMLSEIYRVLKKDGILHITTANKWWPYEPHYKLLFLSYLPEKLADYYVKFSGQGDSYGGIKLPSYSNFRSQVARYFEVNDITLNLIESFEKYDFHLERGRKVIIVGFLLRYLRIMENYWLGRVLQELIRSLLLHVSLGWLFIARPKKINDK